VAAPGLAPLAKGKGSQSVLNFVRPKVLIACEIKINSDISKCFILRDWFRRMSK
jgi:hypothetical protein